MFPPSAYSTHLYNDGSFFVWDLVFSGRLRPLRVSGNPWAQVCQHSQKPVFWCCQPPLQREAGFSVGVSPGTAVRDPLRMKRLTRLTPNQRCTLFSSAPGKARCGFSEAFLNTRRFCGHTYPLFPVCPPVVSLPLNCVGEHAACHPGLR